MGSQETRILCIEPDELYRSVFLKIFEGQPYSIRFTDPDPFAKNCGGIEADLLFCSLELPEYNPSEIYENIRKTNAALPIIFFTEEDINRHLDWFTNTSSTNVLAKPFTREELLFFLEKLVHNNQAFGLKNYLKPGSTVKTFFLTDAADVRDKIGTIFALANKWGFDFHYDFKIDLVIHELLINALYHAYGFEEEKKGG